MAGWLVTRVTGISGISGLEAAERPQPADTIAAVGKAIETMLKELSGRSPERLVRDRREKFLAMGQKGLAA